MLIITVGSVASRLRKQKVYSGKLGNHVKVELKYGRCLINVNQCGCQIPDCFLNQVACLLAGVHLVSLNQMFIYLLALDVLITIHVK